jgi:hypothetical protein
MERYVIRIVKIFKKFPYFPFPTVKDVTNKISPVISFPHNSKMYYKSPDMVANRPAENNSSPADNKGGSPFTT